MPSCSRRSRSSPRISAAKRLQIYDVPDEGGESTLVCDVARDCLDDEALALRIVEEDCEAVLCGSIEESPFIILADQGCVTRYLAAGLRAPTAADCQAYVARRGLSAEIMERFGLGWAARQWQSLAEVLRRAGFDDRMAVEAGLLGSSDRGRAYDRFRGRLIFPIKNLSNQIIAFGGLLMMRTRPNTSTAPTRPCTRKASTSTA